MGSKTDNIILRALLTLLLAIVPTLSSAETIRVAVASNFAKPMSRLVEQYEAQTKHNVKLSIGSSGKILAQIIHGAPFDIFLSADQHKPIQLEKNGFAITNSRFTYAIGKLALWSIHSNFLDASSSKLKKGEFNKLAIANPKLAPYGQAAHDVLENLGLKEKVMSKLVQGENITQTYQFVSTGNADLGFVSVSQIYSNEKLIKGSVWVVPDTLYNPIKQDAILLKRAENNLVAAEFFTFLSSKEARLVIESHGYTTIPSN